MPASPILAEVERSLSGKMGRELVLRKALKDARKKHDVILVGPRAARGAGRARELVRREALKDARKKHDVILIDSPPALGLLTVNGLVAADWALISSEAQDLAMEGGGGGRARG